MLSYVITNTVQRSTIKTTSYNIWTW